MKLIKYTIKVQASHNYQINGAELEFQLENSNELEQLRKIGKELHKKLLNDLKETTKVDIPTQNIPLNAYKGPSKQEFSNGNDNIPKTENNEPTTKQIEFAKKLGIDVNKFPTKKELSKAIENTKMLNTMNKIGNR